MRAQRCTTAYDFCIKPGKHNLGCGNANYLKDMFRNNNKQLKFTTCQNAKPKHPYSVICIIL